MIIKHYSPIVRVVQVNNAKAVLAAGSEDAVSAEEMHKLVLELFSGGDGAGGTAGAGNGNTAATS